MALLAWEELTRLVEPAELLCEEDLALTELLGPADFELGLVDGLGLAELADFGLDPGKLLRLLETEEMEAGRFLVEVLGKSSSTAMVGWIGRGLCRRAALMIE